MPTDLPNLLTLSRIAAIPLLVLLVALRHPAADLAACVVFSAAAITDYYDGKLARSRRQQSDLGPHAGPDRRQAAGRRRADDAGGARTGSPPSALYPAIVIMLREILVSGLREYLAGIRIGLPVTPLGQVEDRLPDGRAGHAAGGRQRPRICCTSASCRCRLIGEAMLWVAAGLTLWTGWDYLTAGWRHATVPHDPRRNPRRGPDVMVPS